MTTAKAMRLQPLRDALFRAAAMEGTARRQAAGDETVARKTAAGQIHVRLRRDFEARNEKVEPCGSPEPSCSLPVRTGHSHPDRCTLGVFPVQIRLDERFGDLAPIGRQLPFLAISGGRSYFGWSLTVDLIRKPMWMLLKPQ